MKHSIPEHRRATPELRMLWYPHLSGSEFTPDLIDAALRNGRRERAHVLASLLSATGRMLGRSAAAVLTGLAEMQRRRAAVTLARVRPQAAVVAPAAAANDEFAESVGAVPASAQRTAAACPAAGTGNEPPRLAA